MAVRKTLVRSPFSTDQRVELSNDSRLAPTRRPPVSNPPNLNSGLSERHVGAQNNDDVLTHAAGRLCIK